MRLSRRLNWKASTNDYTAVVDRIRTSGEPFLDLTISNPSRAGFTPRADINDALSAVDLSVWTPSPLGLVRAREAVAAHFTQNDVECDAEDVVITASTSDAYMLLFKVLGDPEDNLVTHAPSYPLLDHLAALESLELRHARSFHSKGRWRTNAEEITSLVDERTAAIVLVSPNNPTGEVFGRETIMAIARELEQKGCEVPIIVDQVFADYPLEEDARHLMPEEIPNVPVVVLGGLSKTAALPQLKLGWMRLLGTSRDREALRSALEIVSDAYLSVADPVQLALPSIFASTSDVRVEIRRRCRRNLEALRGRFEGVESIEVPLVGGGWTAPVRLPLLDDGDPAIRLARSHRVIVQPGWLYDFPASGWIVLSLVTPPALFDEAIARIG
ncbi:MAG: pyridoxal phosphate-dependent aminotransferase [Acidobacteria bacterium]|nr:pyridoxal phosphate-dependent aminotransferase [Acidobacteriota bacterium]